MEDRTRELERLRGEASSLAENVEESSRNMENMEARANWIRNKKKH